MMRTVSVVCLTFFAVALSAMSPLQADENPKESGKNVEATKVIAGPLDFVVKDIDGEEVSLAKYKGNVVLIVNVASKCGLTPQYKDLQALHEKYNERGLRILAFPANNFGGQEPWREEKIKEYCTTEFGVKFAMFSKVSVKGKDICPLYEYLTSKEKNGEFGGDIEWNFGKFLLDREGKVIARFHPKTAPDDEKLVAAIEAALDAKP
ncbi:MAG: glutathione peroxidase [Phycisphaerae bacterium]